MLNFFVFRRKRNKVIKRLFCNAKRKSKNAARLEELAEAVANNRMDEFVMRIPAEVDRDADIVLMEAAKRLDYFRRTHNLNSAA